MSITVYTVLCWHDSSKTTNVYCIPERELSRILGRKPKLKDDDILLAYLIYFDDLERYQVCSSSNVIRTVASFKDFSYEFFDSVNALSQSVFSDEIKSHDYVLYIY
jgi:hypothetical protein